MKEKKKQIHRIKNNYKKLMSFVSVVTENGISTIKGTLIGRVIAPERNGNGFVMQVKIGNNEVVKILVETSDAEPVEIFDFEEITVKGNVFDNIIIEDRPYLFMVAESVTGSGNISKAMNLENIDITISNLRRYALAKRAEANESIQNNVNEMFSKINLDGLVVFTIKNGNLAMYGKGDFNAKDIQTIAYQLLKLTANNNPDYTWHFE